MAILLAGKCDNNPSESTMERFKFMVDGLLPIGIFNNGGVRDRFFDGGSFYVRNFVWMR